MPKLTYWVAISKENSSVYSLRAKTRKEVLVLLNYRGDRYCVSHEAPRKITIEYSDGFDLLDRCLGCESPPWEEVATETAVKRPRVMLRPRPPD